MRFKPVFGFILALIFVVVMVSFAPLIIGETVLETDINLTESAADQLEGVEGFSMAGISILSIAAFLAVILFIIIALVFALSLFR